MFKYTTQKQLEIFDFKTEFESKLDPNNRWVKMAKLLEWDKLAEIYGQNFSSTMGATSVDARVVIGALIIKHIEGKDDRGTIETIKENAYMQFFLGFDHFSFDSVFDGLLFVFFFLFALVGNALCGLFCFFCQLLGIKQRKLIGIFTGNKAFASHTKYQSF